MKVRVIEAKSPHDEMCRQIRVEVDGDLILSVEDGEPEDNTLYRGFAGYTKLRELISRVAPSVEVIEESGEWE